VDDLSKQGSSSVKEMVRQMSETKPDSSKEEKKEAKKAESDEESDDEDTRDMEGNMTTKAGEEVSLFPLSSCH